MVKKIGAKVCIVALAFLVSIFLISFAAAKINVSIGSTSAVDSGTSDTTGSGTNYSNTSTLTSQIPMMTFNVTLINNTDILYNVTAGGFLTPAGLNASFYLVTEGKSTWTLIDRSYNCTPYGTAPQTRASCWMNISTGLGNFNISMGRYNITAVISTAESIAGKNSTFNVTMVTFDHTPPFNVNITGVNSGQNHSVRSNAGNLTLNVSIADALQGLNASTSISAVIFNIMNVTGNTNKTLRATREGTSQYWSTSVNTSHFPNGKYNITVAVNDSAGNFNSTANSTTTPPIFTLFFDNTLPSVSMSCTPAKVTAGDTVTCSCSGSATSGINSTAYTTNPSTANTGTFTETCSVSSRSGLTNTGDSTFTIELGASSAGTSAGGGGGGGTSTVTWSSTIPATDKELSEKGEVTRSLGSKERVTIKVGGERHHVGVVSLTTDSATLEISSTPQTVTLKVGESKKFELTGDNFYDVLVTLKSIAASKADVTIAPINEEIPAAEPPSETGQEGTEAGGAGEGGAAGALGKSGKIIAIIIVLVIIIAAIVWYVMRKR